MKWWIILMVYSVTWRNKIKSDCLNSYWLIINENQPFLSSVLNIFWWSDRSPQLEHVFRSFPSLTIVALHCSRLSVMSFFILTDKHGGQRCHIYFLIRQRPGRSSQDLDTTQSGCCRTNMLKSSGLKIPGRGPKHSSPMGRTSAGGTSSPVVPKDSKSLPPVGEKKALCFFRWSSVVG